MLKRFSRKKLIKTTYIKCDCGHDKLTNTVQTEYLCNCGKVYDSQGNVLYEKNS